MSAYPKDDTFADIRFSDTFVRVGMFSEGVFIGIDCDGRDGQPDMHAASVLSIQEARRLRNWLSDAVTAWVKTWVADD